MKKLCFDVGWFDLQLKSLKDWFINRDYPVKITDEQLRQVCSRNREELLKVNAKCPSVVAVPFILTTFSILGSS